MAHPRRLDDQPSGRPRLGGPGYALVERTAKTIKRHGMLSGGESVVVAVSGGPDSTCLLDALGRLAGVLDLTLVAAHVDHGLSDISERVAARVARDAAEAGYDVHVVRAHELAGPNLHARAREFRYAFFESVAERTQASRIATGHTLDDRVETTLARLIHGAGPEGLAGVPPVEGNRIRPLIESRRHETRAYCVERSLEFVDDPANEDLRFERAAIRTKVLRAIEEHWGEGAIRAMATTAERVHDDSVALGRVTDTMYHQLARSTDGAVTFPLDEISRIPRAIRRRLLERAVGRVRDRSGGIEAALDALDGPRKPVARFAVASGIEIVVSSNEVTVTRPA